MILTQRDKELFRKNPMRALEALTPGGSEFAGDPVYCYAYIKNKIETLQDLVICKQKEINHIRSGINLED
jgi:hypothetical protein